ncbi:MAG: PilZ domain-containing protein [Candidatus Glassbacteria bacterium]|nr:PilZ domain-containing protein [Candidatus Glassbacteria bacterium]
MATKEVRRHPRREKEFRVEYTVISGSSVLRVLEARTLDFSVSGARIETRQQLVVSDQLSVRIEVPDLQVFRQDSGGGKKYQTIPIMCFGRVRWVEPGQGDGPLRAGIRFERITEDNRLYLSRLLEKEPAEKSS